MPFFGGAGPRNTGVNPRANMPMSPGSGLAGMLQRRIGQAPPPPGLGGAVAAPEVGMQPPPNGLLSSLVNAQRGPGLGGATPQFAPGPRRMARRMGRGY